MDKEQRRNKRKKEENWVDINIISEKHNPDNSTFTAFSEDISLGGMKIITDQQFKVNTLLNLKITLQKSRRIIFMRARVRWVKKDMEKELYEMGVEFIDASPNRLMILISHLYSAAQDQ
jgi:c-di-GMP-binding flagellar brake protein YcgR